MRTPRPPAGPFLKWAGGKGQLLPALLKVIPRKMQTYHEPFLGGGAVFFKLASEQGRFERAVLSDENKELIDCYKIVRDFPDELTARLREHWNLNWNTSTSFREIREQHPDNLNHIDRAARTIYLNRTCFNGLYRVNKSGQFNVPFGKYGNPSLFREENIRACSYALNHYAAMLNGDFVVAIDDAEEGDVVYFDPPYVPVSETANFASYTSSGFTMDDQIRLSIAFKNIVARGGLAILSNSDVPFVRDLYEGFEILVVQAKRNINADGEGRGTVGELIVVGKPAS